MKNIFISLIFFSCFACLQDNIIVNPRSIKESKKHNAFISEFVGDKSFIKLGTDKYFIGEVYLTYKIDSKKVHKNAISLLFKTINIKSKKFECPDYTKFKIIADGLVYDLGNDSNNLECSIPIDTTNFLLIYLDGAEETKINYKKI
jgi:hypothetical protein